MSPVCNCLLGKREGRGFTGRGGPSLRASTEHPHTAWGVCNEPCGLFQVLLKRNHRPSPGQRCLITSSFNALFSVSLPSTWLRPPVVFISLSFPCFLTSRWTSPFSPPPPKSLKSQVRRHQRADVFTQTRKAPSELQITHQQQLGGFENSLLS